MFKSVKLIWKEFIENYFNKLFPNSKLLCILIDYQQMNMFRMESNVYQ